MLIFVGSVHIVFHHIRDIASGAHKDTVVIPQICFASWGIRPSQTQGSVPWNGRVENTEGKQALKSFTLGRTERRCRTILVFGLTVRREIP